jgi:hypothetical protein
MSDTIKDPEFTGDQIQFARHVDLMPAEATHVQECGFLLRQIDQRQAEGFITHGITVEGVTFVPDGESKRPLLVLAEVEYTTLAGKREKYREVFLDDAVMPLLIFRVIEEQATAQEKQKLTLDQHYVVMTHEFRYGMNVRALQIPVAFGSREGGSALRALERETKINRYIDINGDDFVPLGEGALRHSVLTETLFPLVAEIDVAPQALTNIISQISGTHAGDPPERMWPLIMPMEDAWTRAVLKPRECPSEVKEALTYYMFNNGYLGTVNQPVRDYKPNQPMLDRNSTPPEPSPA